MDQNATWYGARPWPRRICVRWVPSSPAIFGPCLLWRNGRPDKSSAVAVTAATAGLWSQLAQINIAADTLQIPAKQMTRMFNDSGCWVLIWVQCIGGTFSAYSRWCQQRTCQRRLSTMRQTSLRSRKESCRRQGLISIFYGEKSITTARHLICAILFVIEMLHFSFACALI